MLRFSAILLISFLTSIPFSQARVLEGQLAENYLSGSEMVRFAERSPLPSYILMRPGKEIPFKDAAAWVRKIFQLSDDDGFELLDEFGDQLGETHFRFQQTYRGRPIEGATLLLHTRNQKVHSVNGEVYSSAGFAQTSVFTEGSALSAALVSFGAAIYRWESEEETRFLRVETENPMATWYPMGKLVYVPRNGDYENEKLRLAWRFDIYAIEPLGRAWVYVDATTGEVLWKHDRIHTADVVGTAMTKYSGTKPITADYTGTIYRLRETGRGNGIQTYNMQRGTNYGAAVDFTDADNIWNNFNPNKDEVATDAHWGSEMTYDFYWTKFNRNSINGSGFAIRSYVHYNNNYNNAFWDGQRMTYGDGNGTTFTPLTCIDVAGHEITHGLTTFTANLVYQNQSGALNESFSDIFGNSVENYGRPTQWSWKIGEDITPSGNGIRNMQNPNQFQDPDTYLGTYWYTGTADNGGVHTNSGVQNKWFYILTIGESGTNDIGSTYNVTGQGWAKSQAIAYRNLTVYLTANSTYADARFFAIRSAMDLYGACTPEVIATTNAWYAVGVGPIFSSAVIANFTATPTTSCSAPATVAFTNTSSNGGTFLWNFGDGNTSTALNPQHTYTAIGTYTVSLYADGGSCGNNTLVRTGYVVIDTNSACNVTLSPTNNNSLQTACSGTLFDSGGPSANYQPNTNSTVTISPTGAARVTLTFVSFRFELNYDYLYIYDGPSTASPLIGAYTGTTLPNGGTIQSTGGSITLRQYTDPGVEDTGFEVRWLCALPTSAPVADFIGDNLSSCNGLVNFRDISTNGPNAWQWDFGDGFSSTQQNPQHTYQSNGVYTVTMIATNSFGSNTVVKTSYITVNRPAGPTANGASRCGPGTVTLAATGTGTLKWYDAASGGNLVATGPSYTTQVLTNSVVYYVEAETPAPSQFVGPLTPASVGAGGYHNNGTPQYLNFNVTAPMELVSVYVDPGAAGNRTISLWDNTGNLMQSSVVNIGATVGRINLNWTIQPGMYRIGGANMNLYRNNAGASYPYSIANFVSISGSSAGPAYYYYFYNWEVKGLPCLSERSPVPVTIDEIPTAVVTPGGNPVLCPGTILALVASGGDTYSWSTGDTGATLQVTLPGTYSVTPTSTAGCVGSPTTVSVTAGSAVTAAYSFTSNMLVVSFTDLSSGAVSWNWDFGDGNTSTQQNPSHTYSAAGTYTVTLTVTNADGCTSVSTQTVSVSLVGVNVGLGIELQISRIYPNPFSDNFAISLMLPYSGNLRISLCDMHGRPVGMVHDGMVKEGVLELRATALGMLASAPYLLKIEFEGQKRYIRLAKI